MMRRLIILNQFVVLIGSVTHLLVGVKSKPPTKRRIAESLLSWSLLLNVGVLETFFFARHVFRSRGKTEDVDRPAEDRVQSEVAFAHLAFGVLGLLSVRFRGMFWFATIVGQAIFLGGITAVNVRDNVRNEVLLFDVLMSLAHVVLLKAYDPLGDVQPYRSRRRFGAAP
jgi:nitrate reductase NapE component